MEIASITYRKNRVEKYRKEIQKRKEELIKSGECTEENVIDFMSKSNDKRLFFALARIEKDLQDHIKNLELKKKVDIRRKKDIDDFWESECKKVANKSKDELEEDRISLLAKPPRFFRGAGSCYCYCNNVDHNDKDPYKNKKNHSSEQLKKFEINTQKFLGHKTAGEVFIEDERKRINQTIEKRKERISKSADLNTFSSSYLKETVDPFANDNLNKDPITDFRKLNDLLDFMSDRELVKKIAKAISKME